MSREIEGIISKNHKISCTAGKIVTVLSTLISDDVSKLTKEDLVYAYEIPDITSYERFAILTCVLNKVSSIVSYDELPEVLRDIIISCNHNGIMNKSISTKINQLLVGADNDIDCSIEFLRHFSLNKDFNVRGAGVISPQRFVLNIDDCFHSAFSECVKYFIANVDDPRFTKTIQSAMGPIIISNIMGIEGITTSVSRLAVVLRLVSDACNGIMDVLEEEGSEVPKFIEFIGAFENISESILPKLKVSSSLVDTIISLDDEIVHNLKPDTIDFSQHFITALEMNHSSSVKPRALPKEFFESTKSADIINFLDKVLERDISRLPEGVNIIRVGEHLTVMMTDNTTAVSCYSRIGETNICYTDGMATADGILAITNIGDFPRSSALLASIIETKLDSDVSTTLDKIKINRQILSESGSKFVSIDVLESRMRYFKVDSVKRFISLIYMVAQHENNLTLKSAKNSEAIKVSVKLPSQETSLTCRFREAKFNVISSVGPLNFANSLEAVAPYMQQFIYSLTPVQRVKSAEFIISAGSDVGFGDSSTHCVLFSYCMMSMFNAGNMLGLNDAEFTEVVEKCNVFMLFFLPAEMWFNYSSRYRLELALAEKTSTVILQALDNVDIVKKTFSRSNVDQDNILNMISNVSTKMKAADYPNISSLFLGE